MKIVREESLIMKGRYAESAIWAATRKSLHIAICEVEWPEKSGSFTINPAKHGNGVTKIKGGLLKELKRQGWSLEVPLDIATVDRPGKLDAVLPTVFGPVALEWETGNISSSHRALNKMAVGLMKGVIACGILVVPSRDMYRYLTDRVGNMPELEPYLGMWRAIPVKEGILEIVVIEHDAVSTSVPRIPKGTDGRALR